MLLSNLTLNPSSISSTENGTQNICCVKGVLYYSVPASRASRLDGPWKEWCRLKIRLGNGHIPEPTRISIKKKKIKRRVKCWSRPDHVRVELGVVDLTSITKRAQTNGARRGGCP